jgi:UDP-N-acetylglucosamine acyltransferase
VGPYSIISGDIEIGEHTRIGTHVRICGTVAIGPNCYFYHGACIGENAQNWDPISRPQGYSKLIIGSDNIFREYVTVHRSAEAGHATTIGNNNRFMVSVHIGHDCIIGNDVTVANLAQLAGGSEIQDLAYLSAGVLINTRIRVGSGAFVDASSVVVADIPPFFRFSRKGYLYKIEGATMKRAGFDDFSVQSYKDICRKLWKGHTWGEIYKSLSQKDGCVEAMLREFLRSSHTGISCFRLERKASTYRKN